MRIDTRVLEGFLEPANLRALWSLELNAFNFVVSNEVDIATECVAQFREFLRFCNSIIDTAQKQILKRDFTSCGFKVLAA